MAGGIRGTPDWVGFITGSGGAPPAPEAGLLSTIDWAFYFIEPPAVEEPPPPPPAEEAPAPFTRAHPITEFIWRAVEKRERRRIQEEEDALTFVVSDDDF